MNYTFRPMCVTDDLFEASWEYRLCGLQTVEPFPLQWYFFQTYMNVKPRIRTVSPCVVNEVDASYHTVDSRGHNHSLLVNFIVFIFYVFHFLTYICISHTLFITTG